MEKGKVERLDHLGVISGVIKDLGIIDMIDSRLVPDVREEISTGEAVAGMILNSLGVSDRPMTLTPQFFEPRPVEVLFREGVSIKDKGDIAGDVRVHGGLSKTRYKDKRGRMSFWT